MPKYKMIAGFRVKDISVTSMGTQITLDGLGYTIDKKHFNKLELSGRFRAIGRKLKKVFQLEGELSSVDQYLTDTMFSFREK